MSQQIKIPSLREVKKRQENVVISSAFRCGGGGGSGGGGASVATSKSTSSSSLPASSTSAANNNSKKKVFNPYAKKSGTNRSTSSAGGSSANNSMKSHSGTSNHPRTSSSSPHSSFSRASNVRSPRSNATASRSQTPILVEPAASTFSQAFGTPPDEINFNEEERARQRSFDEDLINSAAAANNNNNKSSPAKLDNHASGDKDGTAAALSARESHAFLAPHILHASKRQRGNPLLSHIRNVPFQHASDMVPDYIFAATRCALFLSLRYHKLHPDYIHRRIAELRSDFELRVLLCLVDMDDNASPLLFLNDLCVQNDFTLLLAWSHEEAARYLETYVAFDGKDASLIQRREHTQYIDQITDVLTSSVRSVNKTDVGQLLHQFGCWRNLVKADMDELSLCPGVGAKKVRRLYEAFRKPFSTRAARKRKKIRIEKEAMAEKRKRSVEGIFNEEGQKEESSEKIIPQQEKDESENGKLQNDGITEKNGEELDEEETEVLLSPTEPDDHPLVVKSPSKDAATKDSNLSTIPETIVPI